jgi:rhodanese-related sulfurtransferase
VIVEAAEGGYELIGTPDLCNRYRGDPANLLIVDIRQDWEYSAGHIKGATNFPFEPTWWARWWKRGELEKLLGPDKNRFTVFCGAGLS